MPEKKDKTDDIDQAQEQASAGPRPASAGSDSGEAEALRGAVRDEGEAGQPEGADSAPEGDVSADDLLEDVRRSLITDAVEKEEVEQSKWWNRIIKGSRRKKQAEAAPVAPETPAAVETPFAASPKQEGGQEGYVEQLDELIDMLAVGSGGSSAQPAAGIPSAEPVSPPAEAIQDAVDVEELKKRAFQARTTPEEERSLSEVRSVALDDGEEVFVEVEAKTPDAWQERTKAFENALRPYRRYFYFVFVFVSLVMVVLVSASLYRLYQRSLPPPTAEEVALLPYPVRMNLPGGLSFNLGKGKLDDGKWEPLGPEWLEGTEVCRWIAIPYSRQLEAVVRTFTSEDQIELVMSNNDRLVYTVSAIDQLTIEEMQEIGSDFPCMLLVLAQADTDERWVVTALP